jgi:hypothetical protein
MTVWHYQLDGGLPRSKGTGAEGRADELEQKEVKPLTKFANHFSGASAPDITANSGKMGTLK